MIYTLFADIKKLKAVGEHRADALRRLKIYNFLDLLFHFPVNIIDRRYRQEIVSVNNGEVFTCIASVIKHNIPEYRRSKKPYIIECMVNNCPLEVIYFNYSQEYLANNFPINDNVVLSGKMMVNAGQKKITHPEIVESVQNLNKVSRLEPVYNLSKGLTTRVVGSLVQQVLRMAPKLPEWLPKEILLENNWVGWNESLMKIHYPNSYDDISFSSKYRNRLAFDEALAHQISMLLARNTEINIAKEKLDFTGKYSNKLKELLPFELTDAQKNAIADIESDQKSGIRGYRLLQGDVGSGKTLVAFIAMLNAVEAGKQAVMMVPTEVLAVQHYKSLLKYANELGINLGLLVSNLPVKLTNETLEKISSGELNIIIGTHSLFQERVEFKDLSLVVVDEQHRFGVSQRMMLLNKSKTADLLMMSATPIPRTLTMVLYGDMDCSIISEKPKNRKEITTSINSLKNVDVILNKLESFHAKGEKVYWVCPLVEESEKMPLANVTSRYNALQELFSNKVALVHGKQNASEREDEMMAFSSGEKFILVATTVIEVGVDVPEATLMVIENAERFGLSQLHQLRGRVGRSDRQSYCVMLYDILSKVAKERLISLRSTNDGFVLAEKDLELRGGGDLMGVKQSGLPNFKAIDLDHHSHLLAQARKYAKHVVDTDPKLEKNPNLKTLLKIFSYDKGLEY